MTKIYVIGIGYKPFAKREKEIIRTSRFLLASKRLFEVFKRYKEFERVKKKVLVIDTVDETIDFIREKLREYEQKTLPSKLKTQNSELRTIVVLASGDPLFVGIGRRIINEFGKDMVEIIPDLSSIQVAFSRIKEPWDDAFLLSLHEGRGIKRKRKLKYSIRDIPDLLVEHKKIAILTDRENNPTEIAKSLISSSLTRHSSAVMYVCEKLGYPDEKLTAGVPEDISRLSFPSPNVVIVLKKI